MNWIDKSSYNDKSLEAKIWLDKDTVLRCTLEYRQNFITGRAYWEHRIFENIECV